MIRAFRSELIKFRRWSSLLALAAMVGLTAILVYAAMHQRLHAHDARAAALRILWSGYSGATTIETPGVVLLEAIAIITVAAAVSSEWSNGTIRNLLSREPGRIRLLGGKVVALLLFVAAGALLALLAGLGSAALAASQLQVDTSQWFTELGISTWIAFAANAILAVTVLACLGVLAAVVTRSAAGSVGLALVYVLVAENLISLIWPDQVQWLPVHVLAALVSLAITGVGTTAISSYSLAVTIALGYAVAFVALSLILFRRMDVTA